MTRIQQLLWWGVCFSVPAITMTAGGKAWPETGQYEAPPVFTATQVLPPDLAHSSNYTVDARVGLENFQYVFRLQTKWGPFTVKGSDLLRVRAREIAATAKLETVGGTETAVGAAGRTAMRPVETAKDLVTAPGQTISDTVKGVGRIFGSADASMKATDPHKETILASVTGGATARRKLAFDLGVDPNTSFPPLGDELKRVATASAVGEWLGLPALQSVRAAQPLRYARCCATNRQRTSKRTAARRSPPWVFRRRRWTPSTPRPI